jgi:hypothetical protein
MTACSFSTVAPLIVVIVTFVVGVYVYRDRGDSFACGLIQQV